MLSQLRLLARNPKYIPSVYNYCDRWCEYCGLSDRCLLFASERLTAPWRSPDGDSAIEPMLRELHDDIRAEAGRRSIDLEAVSAAAPGHPVLEVEEEAGTLHPLEFLARHYVDQASTFLGSGPVCAGSRRGEPEPRPAPLEVIAWFHVMIASKIYRALASHHLALTEAPDLLADALGSAKIALIGIDRSLAAFQELPQKDDGARNSALMELLGALRTGVEIRFPRARAFVRPGLDDGSGVSSGTRDPVRGSR
jgi:hypothetical protein